MAPLFLGVLGACSNDGDFTQDATLTNAEVKASVYPLTGSFPELPAAYQVSTNSFIRPLVGQTTGEVNFDLAFDMRDDGKVLLIPVRALVPSPPAPRTGAPSIGLQKSTSSYEDLVRAPSGGTYVTDSVTVASQGETYIVKLNSSGCFLGEALYAKLSIDSVLVSQRRIVVKSIANLNCGGYRALTVGIPKD